MKILSINGAGTSGYASAIFLAKLEALTGKPCHEMFDLIAGVSAGSIQAVALGVGMPAAEVAADFEKLAGAIFKKAHWWSGYFKTSKYDAEKLRTILAQTVGSFTLGDVKPKVMVHATRLNAPRIDVRFFKSWNDSDKHFKLADLATASSSAPGYFCPMLLEGDALVDGGVGCNNPSMSALAEAKRLTGTLDHYCLNLMPNVDGGFSTPYVMRKHTMESWAQDIAGICIGSNDQCVRYQANNLMGDRYCGLDFGMGLALDAWTPQLKDIMVRQATKVFDAYGAQVAAALK